MARISEKVTAFVTRESPDGHELLLFRHPYAGVQIPAGTVKENERPEDAVMREATEETGLTALSDCRFLGRTEQKLPKGQRVIVKTSKVYSRPDVTSFDWAFLPQGAQIAVIRRAGGFSQVTYQEFDRVPDPTYVSMCITGWVPDKVLADTQRRHFFRLRFRGATERSWTVYADNHVFTLFWAPLTALPDIVSPQDRWLAFLESTGGT